MDIREAVKIVREFQARHPCVQLTGVALKRSYGINYRDAPAWLSGNKELKNSSASARGFIALAKDIQSDQQAVCRVLTKKTEKAVVTTAESEIDRYRATAVGAARTSRPETAVALSEIALETSVWGGDPIAFEVLPQMIYMHLRHGSAQSLSRWVDHPAMTRLTRSPTALPEPAKQHVRAAAAQLACVLAEGGHYHAAENLFDCRGVQLVGKAPALVRWCVSPVMRGRVRCRTWHGHPYDLAIDQLTCAAEQDAAIDNLQSVDAVRCEVAIRHGRFKDAWEAIEPHFTSALVRLRRSYSLEDRAFVGPPFPRHFHACTHLCYGTIARTVIDGSTSPSADLEDSLLFLHSLLGIDARATSNPKHMGMHRFDEGVQRRAIRFNAQLQPIFESTAHETISSDACDTLAQFAVTLLNLADR